MNPEDFIYVKETKKSFNEAAVAVLKAVEQKGWALFQVYDIRERLATKGFPHDQLKIIEICSAKRSIGILRKNKLASLCMPCRINIIEEKGKIRIAGMKPTIIAEFFPEVAKQDVEQAEKDIKEMIESAK